jgi:hypothetical protein
MYIKIHESRQSNHSYVVVYPSLNAAHAIPYIENEHQVRVEFTENELFHALDKLFKDKQNATIQGCEARDSEV